MALFMKPVHGVTEGALTHEFSDSRGAIHYHNSLPTSLSLPWRWIKQQMNDQLNVSRVLSCQHLFKVCFSNLLSRKIEIKFNQAAKTFRKVLHELH